MNDYYEPSIDHSFPLKVPSKIGVAPSARRQRNIINTINNEHGYNFVKDGAMGTTLDGYSVTAYDLKEKGILMTCDTLNFAAEKYLQNVCRCFVPKGWVVWLWVGQYQFLIPMVRIRKPKKAENEKPAESIVDKLFNSICQPTRRYPSRYRSNHSRLSIP